MKSGQSTTPGGEPVTMEIVKAGEGIEARERANIDIQIATAHKFPRDIAKFQLTAKSLVTADVQTAESCFYSLPRGKNDDGSKKYIDGVSVRFAEIAAYAFGNLRVQTSIIAIEEEWVVAEGVAHDLETNYARRSEVRRRIVDKFGNRFSADMIIVTCNAAMAIAGRNAIFQVVPRALLKNAEAAAVDIIKGYAKTLPERRKACLEWFAGQGIASDIICAYIGVGGEASIDLNKMVILGGIKTALEEGNELTVAEIINSVKRDKEQPGDTDIGAALSKVTGGPKKPAEEAPQSDEQVLTEANAPAIVEKCWSEAQAGEKQTVIRPHLKALKVKAADIDKVTFRHVLKLPIATVAEILTQLSDLKDKRPAAPAAEPDPRVTAVARLTELFATATPEDKLAAKSASGAKDVTLDAFLALPDEDIDLVVKQFTDAAAKRGSSK